LVLLPGRKCFLLFIFSYLNMSMNFFPYRCGE
jgi:hypothetical protein